jgi:hypothetical protein
MSLLCEGHCKCDSTCTLLSKTQFALGHSTERGPSCKLYVAIVTTLVMQSAIVTITILVVIHRLFFYLNTRRFGDWSLFSSLSGTYSTYYLSKIMIVILIYHHHKPIDSINLLGL